MQAGGRRRGRRTFFKKLPPRSHARTLCFARDVFFLADGGTFENALAPVPGRAPHYLRLGELLVSRIFACLTSFEEAVLIHGAYKADRPPWFSLPSLPRLCAPRSVRASIVIRRHLRRLRRNPNARIRCQLSNELTKGGHDCVLEMEEDRELFELAGAKHCQKVRPSQAALAVRSVVGTTLNRLHYDEPDPVEVRNRVERGTPLRARGRVGDRTRRP